MITYSQPGGFDLSFMNDQTDSNYLIYNDGIFHSNSEVTFVSIDDVTSHSGLNDLDFEYASYLFDDPIFKWGLERDRYSADLNL